MAWAPVSLIVLTLILPALTDLSSATFQDDVCLLQTSLQATSHGAQKDPYQQFISGKVVATQLRLGDVLAEDPPQIPANIFNKAMQMTFENPTTGETVHFGPAMTESNMPGTQQAQPQAQPQVMPANVMPANQGAAPTQAPLQQMTVENPQTGELTTGLAVHQNVMPANVMPGNPGAVGAVAPAPAQAPLQNPAEPNVPMQVTTENHKTGQVHTYGTGGAQPWSEMPANVMPANVMPVNEGAEPPVDLDTTNTQAQVDVTNMQRFPSLTGAISGAYNKMKGMVNSLFNKGYDPKPDPDPKPMGNPMPDPKPCPAANCGGPGIIGRAINAVKNKVASVARSVTSMFR